MDNTYVGKYVTVQEIANPDKIYYGKVILFKELYTTATWAGIQKIAQDKLTDEYLNIGDTFSITVSNIEYELQYIAKNKDSSDSATGDVLTFQFKTSLYNRYRFDNNSSSPAVMWKDASIRTELNTTFFNSLPEDLKNVIGTVNKSTLIDDNGTYKLDITQDKIFLPSRTEVYGGPNPAGGVNYSEGAAYNFYVDFSDLSSAGSGNDTNRIKLFNGSSNAWQLRSPDFSNMRIRDINATGGIANVPAYSSSGYPIAPAFCIF